MRVSYRQCLHPVQHCWLNDNIVDLLTGIFVSHRMPDFFLQLFHPHCVLFFFISVLMSPSLCRVLPIYLNSINVILNIFIATENIYLLRLRSAYSPRSIGRREAPISHGHWRLCGLHARSANTHLLKGLL